MSEVRIAYNIAQIHSAADYIWKNNPSVKIWPSRPKSVNDVLAYIKSMIRRVSVDNATALLNDASKWTSYTGTGGFLIQFSSDYEPGDPEIVIDVEVHVDPAIGLLGKEHAYANTVESFSAEEIKSRIGL